MSKWACAERDNCLISGSIPFSSPEPPFLLVTCPTNGGLWSQQKYRMSGKPCVFFARTSHRLMLRIWSWRRGEMYRVYSPMFSDQVLTDRTSKKRWTGWSGVKQKLIETSSVLPRKSSAIFGNFRKMFENYRLAFRRLLENLKKLRKVFRNLRK